MNDFEEAKIDNIIKSKLKKDNYISNQANSVFENFNYSEIRNKEKKTDNAKQNTINTAKSKVVQLSFYQKLNRVLSVAAVSLTVILVGGTALSQVWVFILAPLVGSALAAVIWNYISKDEEV